MGTLDVAPLLPSRIGTGSGTDGATLRSSALPRRTPRCALLDVLHNVRHNNHHGTYSMCMPTA